jgi:translocation and assembly module TamB
MKTFIKYSIAGSVALIMIVLLLAGALLAWVQTGHGQKFIEGAINRYAVWDDGFAAVSGLSGRIPFDMEIREIRIQDVHSEWLIIEKARFSWSLKELLKRNFHIHELGADSVFLKRLPEIEPRERERERTPLEDIQWSWPLPPLALEKLYLREAHVGGDVLGEEAAFSLDGHMLADRQGFSFADLNLVRLDKPETTIHLRVSLTKAPYHLDLDVSLYDSATLPSWIEHPDFPGIISLEIKGSAPLHSWKGRLDLEGLDKFRAAVDLRIDTGEKNRFSGQGEFFMSPALVPEPFSVYVGEPFALLVSGELEPDNIIRVDELRISSPALDLAGQAGFNPDRLKLDGRAQLSVQDINPFISRSALVSHDPAHVEASFKGPLSSLETQAVVTLGRVTGHGLSVSGTNLDLLALPGESSKDPLLKTRGSLFLKGLDYSRYPGLPADYAMNFDLTYLSENKVVIDKFDLRAKDLGSSISGDLDLNTLTFFSTIDFSLKKFGQFLPPEAAELGFSGDLTLNARAEGNMEKKIFTVEAQTSLQDFSTRDEIMNLLAGTNPSLKLSLALEQDLILRIRESFLTTPEINFRGEGSFDTKHELVDFQARIQLADLSGLGSTLNQDLGGEVLVSAGVKGNLLEPRMEVKALVNQLRINDLDPMDIRANLLSADTPELLSGSLDLNVLQTSLGLDLYTDFSLRDKNLDLKNLSLRGLDLIATADLTVDLDRMLAQGGIRAGSSDLGELGRFFNLELGGGFEADLNLVPTGEDQDILFRLKASGISTEFLSLDLLESSGELKNVHTQGFINAKLSLDGVSASNVYLTSLKAQVAGRDKDFDFKTRLSGHVQEDLELSLAGNYSQRYEGHAVNISALDGRFAHSDFTIKSPFTFSHSSELSDLSLVEMALGSSFLKLRARMSPESVDGEATVRGLPLSEIPFPGLEGLQGVLSMDLEIQGDPTTPLATADIRIEGLVAALEAMQEFKPLNIHTAARLEPGLAVFDSTILEDDLTLADIHFQVPLQVSVMPADLSIPDPVPLGGRLSSRIRLEKITSMLLPPDQIVSGMLSADVNINGTHRAPSLDGQIQVSQTSYENLEAGLYLADINILLRATEKMIEVEEFRATDGKTGRLTGSGFLYLDFDDKLPWTFELKIQAAEVLNHKLAQVSISEGGIKLSGNRDAASVAGVLTFGRIEATLPDKAPPEIAELEVTEINRETPKEIPFSQRPGKEPYPVDLNIELRFPARVYVRGYGLDSEWSGNLNIEGQAHQPLIRGNLEVVRGRLVFLDRRFNLSDSFIFLDGSYPPDPIVDITAVYGHKDKNITIRVRGPAMNPDLVFSSDPPMHEDEILAWVLFGRDLSTLTPFQAITLANAARTLATGDTSPGIMDQIRSMVGVDVIDITTDPDEGETQFGLGKYVHERVYVQVRKGTASGKDSVSVEVELTPRISLESSFDSDSAGGVGLFWKHDY